MKLTGYKKIYFGDWLIILSCYQHCLYTVKAYNASTDTTVSIDKMYAAESDAFNVMLEKTKSVMFNL